MKHYTRKAVKWGIFAGIGFGIANIIDDLYNGDDLELWKLIFKILFFSIFMGLFFYYNFKRQSKKESKES